MKWEAHEIWKEPDCFILGGGHSIAKEFNVPEELIPISKESFVEFGNYLKPFLGNKNVIGVNLSAFLGDWVDVAYWGDTDTYLYYKGWFDTYGGLKVASAGKFLQPRYKSIKCLEKKHEKGFYTDRKTLTWAGFNSGAAAINLAYYLGAKRVFLLGFDMYSLPNERPHWHGGYPDKKENFTNKDAQNGKVPRRTKVQPPYKRQLQGFAPISKAIQGIDLEVINLSPGTKIESLPVASFWDYFDKQGNSIKGTKNKQESKSSPIVHIKDEPTNKPIKTGSDKVNFVCVLKSGGDFNWEYVFHLRNGIERNYSGDFNFYCLTDKALNLIGVQEIKLKHNWPGWWSKIELFRPGLFTDFCIYFDLDTIILDNIDEFVRISKTLSFAGLMGFGSVAQKETNRTNFASGVMVGNFFSVSSLYTVFKEKPDSFMQMYKAYIPRWERGDQGFIANLIGRKDICKLQSVLPDNCIIGKVQTNLGKKQIVNARILAWSGKPRLHKFKQGWIYNAWTEN